MAEPMRLLAGLICGLLVLAPAAGPAAAQPVPGFLKPGPLVLPGERALEEMRAREKKFLRPDRLDRPDRALGDLFRDPLLKFGYGPKVWKTPKSDDPPKVKPPPRYEAFRWLDSDRDGFISRQEYFTGRSSVTFAGPAGQARRRAALRRLDSRFRDADRNRDGRVSARELEGLGNARF